VAVADLTLQYKAHSHHVCTSARPHASVVSFSLFSLCRVYFQAAHTDDILIRIGSVSSPLVAHYSYGPWLSTKRTTAASSKPTEWIHTSSYASSV
jgi:hypothetical protein